MIRSTMIVEIAGAPAAHVKESLSQYILNLNRVNEVEVHSIKISEPAAIPDSPGMFTCFAEADFSSHDMARLSEIVFDFMPSSIEITDPVTVEMDNVQATELFNNISGRMHRYDDIAKASYAKIKQLTNIIKKQHEAAKPKAAQVKKAAKKSSAKKKAVKKTAKKSSTKKKSVKKKSKK